MLGKDHVGSVEWVSNGFQEDLETVGKDEVCVDVRKESRSRRNVMQTVNKNILHVGLQERDMGG